MYEQNPQRAVLTYNLDEEYQIRIEEPKDFYESYFRDVYSQAAKAVTGIINQNIDPNGKAYPFAKETKEFNNIVAFVGGRGTGKTSCMVSFAKYLISKKDENDKLENFEINELSKYKFVSLPTIDPSLFEKEENIIEVVLAQMFSDFETILKNSQREIDQDIRRKLIEHFDVVYRNLQTIIKGRKNYDGESLETLSKLAQSTNLRDNFKDLIHKFIKLKADSEKGYLIIPIDDFDLNVKAAAEMSEQIRKYFMIPNVIILMSVNMDQLKDAKELSIRQDFKEMKDLMKEDPAQMAVEYLLKLIPDNRRYYMPEIKYNFKNTFIKRIGLFDDCSIDINGKKYSDCVKIDEYIYSKIYQKTGLIFLPKENGNNLLIPNTHRRLKEFVFFLEKKLKCDDNCRYLNLRHFEDYMINVYLPSLVSKKHHPYLKCIFNTDLMQLNYTLISTFHDVISKEAYTYNPQLYSLDNPLKTFPNFRPDKTDYSLELKELLSFDNNPHNISIGDVLFVIKQTSKYLNNNEFDIFCSAIKLYYSIELLKLESENKHKELKTIVGNSLLPCETLMRIVSHKLYNFESNSTKRLSRVVYKYSNSNKECNIYRLFVVYKGNSYEYRRRSIKDFYKGYNYSNGNKYVLDLFSCLVNAYYLYNSINDDNISNEEKNIIRTLLKVDNKYEYSIIPFHSIDLIEEVLYKWFEIQNEDLLDEIKSIFIKIKERVANSVKSLSDINNYLTDIIDNSYIYNELINDKIGRSISNNDAMQINIDFKTDDPNSFVSFIKKLEYDNKDIEKKQYIDKIKSEFSRFSQIILKPNGNKIFSNFYNEELKLFNEYMMIFNKSEHISLLINLLKNQYKKYPSQKLKDFVDDNRDKLTILIDQINSQIEL